MSTLLSFDEVIDIGYEIFLDMAPDNLEAADVIIFSALFDERGAAEVVDNGADWPEHVGFDVDADRYAEVRVGLVNEENDALDDIYARLLISRDPEQKFCHILWKRD